MPTWSKSDAAASVRAAVRPMNRRTVLAGGARLATLAAARALAPAVFTGCAAGLPKGSDPIVVGLLHSQTGTLAISETALRDAELFAIEEINASGGLLGRPLEPRSPDPRSRPLDLFPKRARELFERHRAAVIFGCWTSSSRKAVIPVLEEFDKFLFYPVQFEGNEASRNVVYGGSVPNQQILPVIEWLLSPAGGIRERIFLMGSDYVFPRTANLIVKRSLATRGLEPAGAAYAPLGHRQFTGAVEMILASKANAVLSTVNGDSNVAFFAALAEAGVKAEDVPVISTSIGEDELRNLPPAHVQGQLAAGGYFQSVATDANQSWVKRFRHEFGYDRVTSDPMEATYCLVHLWKQAVERAGSLDTTAVRQVFEDELHFAGPGGEARIDPKSQYAFRRFRLGRIRSDRQFDIVHESTDSIPPEPYPQVAFPGWHCDWTAEGLTRGPEVAIDGDF
jgi:urea transport system substrate-binding protein